MAKTKKIAKTILGLYILIIAIAVFIQIMSLGIQKIISWIPNFLIVSVIVLITIYYLFRDKYTEYSLMQKYQDQKIVDRIIKQILWEGAGYEHVVDMFGRADSIDLKILRGKKREVLKYNYSNQRRAYLFRVTLENDKVIGWETLNTSYRRTKFVKPITLVDYG